MAARVESLESRRRARRAKVVRESARLAPSLRLAPPPPSPPAREPVGVAELLTEAGRELWRQIRPNTLSDINDEIADRLRRMPTRLNEFGYDPWGLDVDSMRRALVITTVLYRYYFRVETHGIGNIPDGRVMVISNHAGQVALDAAMIGTAMILECEPPRIVRGMGEYWLPTLPFVNLMMSRTGSVVGTPKNCIDLLNLGEAVIAFPEGVRGMNKLFSERYRLQRFGSGFMRLALQARAPIVPVAVVGSEEQAPSIANLKRFGQLLGMPAFPITLTWPLLGPLGLLPLPVKYRIYFGKPIRFEGDPDDEDAVIDRKVARVVEVIQSMLDRGLRERPGIFF